MTPGLIDFIRARLDEEAGIALKAQHELEEWGGTGEAFTDAFWKRTTIDADNIMDLIERQGPDRMLAEADAKRLRLEEIERELADDPTNETAQWQLQVEALPYAGQPGYREEWKP